MSDWKARWQLKPRSFQFPRGEETIIRVIGDARGGDQSRLGFDICSQILQMRLVPIPHSDPVPRLTVLDIGESAARHLRNHHLVFICKILRTCMFLTTFRLNGGAMLGSDAIDSIGYVLAECFELTTFEFSKTGYRNLHSEIEMTNILTRHGSRLTTLILSNGRFAKGRRFATALPHCRSMRNLILEDNDLNDEDIAYLAEGARLCPSLRTLNLHGNVFGDIGASSLAFFVSPRVAIDISFTNAGNEGKAALRLAGIVFAD